MKALAEESKFVEKALAAATKVLKPPHSIKRGAALLYEVTVDNNLKVTIDPKKPMRGVSAFQTDLCVFEAKSANVAIPRVVLEFKTKISTHDVLTYSAKARRHKQVYPYLRYGLVVSEVATVPRRFFVHNEALDFFVALKGVKDAALGTTICTPAQSRDGNIRADGAHRFRGQAAAELSLRDYARRDLGEAGSAANKSPEAFGVIR